MYKLVNGSHGDLANDYRIPPTFRPLSDCYTDVRGVQVVQVDSI